MDIPKSPADVQRLLYQKIPKMIEKLDHCTADESLKLAIAIEKLSTLYVNSLKR